MRKIPKIRISSLWLPVVLIFSYFGKTNLLFYFAISSLLHELGHMFALILQRKSVQKITVGITGTVIQSDRLSYTEELIAVVAGPIVNLTLLFLVSSDSLWFMMNLSLLCYNLLPILPLDGGRILAAILAKWFPERTAGVLRGMFAAVGCALFFSILFRLRDAMSMGEGFWLLAAVFLWNLSILLWQEKRLHFLY